MSRPFDRGQGQATAAAAATSEGPTREGQGWAVGAGTDAEGMSIEDAVALPEIDTGWVRAIGDTVAVPARWHEHGNPSARGVVATVGLSLPALAVVRAGVSDPRVVARYRAKVAYAGPDQCWHFTGAIHPHGHGRFFVGQYTDTGGARRGVVVIAHRFGWATTYGPGSLGQVPVLAHDCDEAGCQNPAHLAPATMASNHHDWDTRRWQLGSPLRDTGRARTRDPCSDPDRAGSLLPRELLVSAHWTAISSCCGDQASCPPQHAVRSNLSPARRWWR